MYETRLIPCTTYVRSWKACFRGPSTRGNSNCRRTFIGVALQMLQQFTGINFIFYFGITFFQQLGTISNPFMVSLITTLVNVLSTPISFWAIEKRGRRPLLIVGAVVMGILQIIIAIIGMTAGKPEVTHTPDAVVWMIGLICLNIAVFAITWGPVAWVVVGEIFPLPIRARGVGISTASNWFFNFFIALVTPYLVGEEAGSAGLGPTVFFIWGIFCFFSAAFAHFFVPEMKGLTLEQVDKMMEEVTPQKSADWVPTSTFTFEARQAMDSRGAVDENGRENPDAVPLA